MCWPNRSVLKIGFRTEDDDGSPWLFEAPGFFAEGSWAFENRSDVALGIAGVEELSRSGRDTSFHTVHFIPCTTRSHSLTMPPMSFVGVVTKAGFMKKTATVTVSRWVIDKRTGKVGGDQSNVLLTALPYNPT
jgi:hypothetical protein